MFSPRLSGLEKNKRIAWIEVCCYNNM